MFLTFQQKTFLILLAIYECILLNFYFTHSANSKRKSTNSFDEVSQHEKSRI